MPQVSKTDRDFLDAFKDDEPIIAGHRLTPIQASAIVRRLDAIQEEFAVLARESEDRWRRQREADERQRQGVGRKADQGANRRADGRAGTGKNAKKGI